MNILVGDSKEQEYNLYGYTEEDFSGENTNDYLYGKLNKEVELVIYKGAITDTAITTIDENNYVKVDVLKTPQSLTLTKGNEVLGVFDGSQSLILDIDCIDETLYVSKKELQNILKNLNDISEKETADRKAADEQLQQNINAVRDQLSEDIDNTNKRIDQTNKNLSDTNDKIDKETQDRINNYNDLLKLINQEVTDRKEAIRQETANRKEAIDNLETKLNNKLDTKLDKANADKDIVKDINISVNGDNISLDASYINLNTQQESAGKRNIGLANDNNAGLMSIADYKSIRELQEKVQNFESKTTRLLYNIKTDSTQEDINQFVTNLGYKKPFEGIAVVVPKQDGTHHIWHYYENDSIGWKDDGLDTVSNFTNETAGIIKGSAIDGKVYAETDGTGSVYGWDTLNNKVNTNTLNIEKNALSISKVFNDLSQEVSNREAADRTLQSNINSNTDKIADLKEDLDKEISDRQSADINIQNNINTVNTSLKKLIGDEKERAQLEEANLLNKINAEVTNRKNADSQLSLQIGEEETRAQLAEQSLSKDIQDATKTLTNQIDTETNNRKQGDKDLQDQIDELKEKGVSNTIIRRWVAD